MSLSMIRCPDNQINASFIDISRIKWLRSTGRLSARARSNRRHSGEASKTMDYKSVFTNLCLELQRNGSWIKGLGKNPFTHSLTAVPFVRGHRSVFPRTPRNTGVYTRHPTFVTATSGELTRLPAKLSKNGMRVYTLSDIVCIHGLRSEGVKGPVKYVFSLYTKYAYWNI